MSAAFVGTPDGQARLAPFSLRLSRDERAALILAAGDEPLGTYIKARLFDEAPPRSARRPKSVRDQRAIANLLARMGTSDLAASLRTLADAARIGSLDCDDEVAGALAAACADIRAMRLMLVSALGLKSAPPAPGAPPPRRAFSLAANGEHGK